MITGESLSVPLTEIIGGRPFEGSGERDRRWRCRKEINESETHNCHYKSKCNEACEEVSKVNAGHGLPQAFMAGAHQDRHIPVFCSTALNYRNVWLLPVL